MPGETHRRRQGMSLGWRLCAPYLLAWQLSVTNRLPQGSVLGPCLEPCPWEPDFIAKTVGRRCCCIQDDPLPPAPDPVTARSHPTRRMAHGLPSRKMYQAARHKKRERTQSQAAHRERTQSQAAHWKRTQSEATRHKTGSLVHIWGWKAMCHSDFEYSLRGPTIATVTSAKPSWFIPLHSPILLHAVRPSFIFWIAARLAFCPYMMVVMDWCWMSMDHIGVTHLTWNGSGKCSEKEPVFPSRQTQCRTGCRCLWFSRRRWRSTTRCWSIYKRTWIPLVRPWD